jgi:signal transduction histidine kinase
VARHASATRAKVSMSFNEANLRLTIRDNGQGFDPQTLDEAEGLGMTNMRERANLVGGDFDVQSKPGGGTRISATIPLTES